MRSSGISSTARARSWIALALCVSGAWIAHPAGAQKGIEVPPLLTGEGALQNDSFLPGAAAPTKKIAEGDRAFVKARGVPAGSSASWDEALDLWHAALVESALDDAVVADADGPDTLGVLERDPDGSLARRAETVESAVVRRVRTLDPKLLDAWRARFEALATHELESAGSDPVRLERSAHGHPLTRAAWRADVHLFDLAFESGRFANARAWLARARDEAELFQPLDPAWSAALARRAAALAAFEPDSSPSPTTPSPTTWKSAAHLHLVTQIPLHGADADDARSRERRPRPGIAFVGEETVVVQSADLLYLLAPAGSATSLDLASVAAGMTLTFAPTFSDARSDLAAWPAGDARHLVVTAGRALGARGNALLCFERPRGTGGTGELRAVWGYGDQAFHPAGGETRAIEEALEAGVWEFQPGPLLEGGRVLVQARQWPGEGSRPARVDEGQVRAWCLAIDLESGLVVWRRWLAAGAVLEGSSAQRSPEARGAARPAAPLARHAGRVFAGTGLGVGAQLDSADGRLLWSVRASRRASEGARREVALPPLYTDTCGADPAQAALWLWTPDDSNDIYRMRDDADVDGRGIFARPPEKLRASERVLGGDTCQIAGWDPAQAPRSLWMQDLHSGARWNAAPIEREESAPAEVLLAPRRALYATDRALYFCDRGRELALIDRILLPGAGRREQPALAGRAERVYVADRSTLWIFDAR